MYRSNHFESQNVGQGPSVGLDLSDDKSSVRRPNQQMPFTSSVKAVGVQADSIQAGSVQATDKNGHALRSHSPHSEVHYSQAQQPQPFSQLPPSAELQAPDLTGQQSFFKNDAARHTNLNQTHLNSQEQTYTPRQDPQTALDQAAPLSLASRMEQRQPAQQGQLAQTAAQTVAVQNQSGIDPQISALFSAMGRASQLSHSQLAARLQTSPSLISALENGSLNELPQWEEIEPVICRYADLMNIDDRAILRRLREQLTEHYLTNMTTDQQSGVTGSAHFQQATHHQETPPPLHTEHTQGGTSIMPSSDMSLKAFANGNLTSNKADQDQFQRGASNEMSTTHQQNNQSLEERFTALTSAVSESQNSSHIIAQTQTKSQPLDTRSAIAGLNNNAPHQMNNYGNAGQRNIHGNQPLTGAVGQQPNYSNPQFLNTAPQQDNRVPVELGQMKAKSKTKWLRIFGNFALIMILLVGFINWQPNRFWSSVDQLPKPISKSIYSLFEFVMPDPLASVYRMNWVHVADPRMRKADKLIVPSVRKLPRIDFSKLGSLNN